MRMLWRAVGVAPTLISSHVTPSARYSRREIHEQCASATAIRAVSSSDVAPYACPAWLRSRATADPEPRDLRYDLCRAWAPRIDAAPVQPDVHLDQHVHLAAGGGHRRGPAARDVEVVHDEREMSPIEERDQPIGVGRVERVGEPDVADAGVGKDLGFAELRATDADGALRDLQPRDFDGLVGLRVRAEPLAGGPCGRLHPLDVALGSRPVDEHAGRAE